MLNDLLGCFGQHLGVFGNMLGGLGQSQSGLVRYQQQGYLSNGLTSQLSLLSNYAPDPEAEKERARAWGRQRAEDWAGQAEEAIERLAFWRGFYSVPVVGLIATFRIKALTARAERMMAEAESWLENLDDEKERGTNE